MISSIEEEQRYSRAYISELASQFREEELIIRVTEAFFVTISSACATTKQLRPTPTSNIGTRGTRIWLSNHLPVASSLNALAGLEYYVALCNLQSMHSYGQAANN